MAQPVNFEGIESYPTPPQAARTERMNRGFLKLHPGSVIHYFTECTDEQFHTHPFSFETHLIEGGYKEEVLLENGDGTWRIETYDRLPGHSHQMPTTVPHRLVGLMGGPCLTRCEYGPTVQKPGFVRLDEQGRAWHRQWDKQEWNPYQP